MEDRPSIGRAVKETTHFSVMFVMTSFVVISALVAFASMWVFGWGMFQRETANFRGETAQQERVFADPNYRIQAYESFYDLCVAVQNTEAQIRSQEAELESGPSAQRRDQVNTNLNALRAAREARINEYNANARMSETRANFHASDLPYQLDTDQEKTTCTP